MRRRDFIIIAAGGTALTWPLVARAQQVKRIGVVMAYAESDPNGQVQVTALRQQLEKLGWTDGRNLRIDLRYAADDSARIRVVATELLRVGPDVIVTNSNLITSIFKSEVGSTPMVFVSVSDPVGSGFVTDLARPTGNVTGFANFQPSMGGKWLEMLREVAPSVERVGIIMHPEPPNFGYLKSAEEAAPAIKIRLTGLNVQSRTDIERAIEAFASESHGGLIIAPNVVTFANSGLIASLAARHRLPAIYPFAFFAKEGGLISYGFDAADQFRQGAVYVDKILRGAKPTDLPVQHPTKFEIVVNLKTAKSLGIEVPGSILARADEVIE
jgi:ABC-type uncharacterized transport system substrate-binding protein